MAPPQAYSGPAGLILTLDEWLQVWASLCRDPAANQILKRKIKRYLEGKMGEIPE